MIPHEIQSASHLSKMKPVAIRVGAILLALTLAGMVAWNLLAVLARKQSTQPVGSAVVEINDAATAVIAADLFGSGVLVPTVVFRNSPLDLALKGVYAPRMAILSARSGADRNVPVGGEILPGVRLYAVHADHVIVERNGAFERLALVRPRGAPLASDIPSSAGAAGGVLSRSELAPMVVDQRQLIGLAQLGSFPDGGIVISDATAGSLASMLGLRQGDIVQKVNDNPVAAKEDLLRIAEQPVPGSKATLDAVRNGQPLRIVFTIQP